MEKDKKTEDFELYRNFNFSSFSFNLDTPIYKYIPFKYVKMMIENKKLLAFPVSSWEDVYENWLEKHIKKDYELKQRNNLPIALGQSWTTEEESDAMWRIYSKIEKQIDAKDISYDNMAIRIKTTPRKLLEQLLKNKKNNETIFIGPVDYLKQEEFEEKKKTILKLYKNNPEKALANSFFIKRNPFEHEKEVRIIVISKTNCKNAEFDIAPDYLIDEYVIDPRIQRKDYYTICKMLMELGVSVMKIRQSELYQWEPFPIIKNRKKPKTKDELKEIIIMRMIQDGNNCNLNDLCLCRVTDLSDLFAKDMYDGILYKFNGDISKWDVSNVKNMSGMFEGSQFNGDISKWDVSKVEDMSWMFYDSPFNGNIDGWNVNNVQSIRGLFNNNSEHSLDEDAEDLFVWKRLHHCRVNKGKDVDEEELDEMDEEELDEINKPLHIQNVWERCHITDSFSPADAYDEGYHYGYLKGNLDAKEGNAFGSGYDDASSYYDYDDQKYHEGYGEGYEKGYCEGKIIFDGIDECDL